MTDIQSFATTQLSLLQDELNAELIESAVLSSALSPNALQRAGAAVIGLTVASTRTGLGGKTVLELEPDSATASNKKDDGTLLLPEHGIRTGDIVRVQSMTGGSAKKKEKAEASKDGVEGVISKVSESKISVTLDKEDVEIPNGRLWIIKLANDITYKRMNFTMNKLQKLSESDTSPFIRCMFGQSSITPISKSDLDSLKVDWISDSLNTSQQEAIKFALLSPEISLIHGPPGTGKTTTLIELILQLTKQNKRLLVCGPSNISVDNIVEKLAHHKLSIVRLGHPARLLPSVVNHSLDVLTQTSEAAEIVRDVRKEMDAKQASIRKTKSGRERKAIYMDLRDLRKEFREREKKCVSNLIRGSKVVLATLHGAGGFHLRQESFDVVIIDEASQALEAQCWVPLLTAKRVVLAGDHLQLPPTIKSLNSKEDKKKKKVDGEEKGVEKKAGGSLEVTLFDRLLKIHGDKIKRMLTVQYRMHDKIVAFPSKELYEGKLTSAEAVKARLLKDLPYDVEDTEDTHEPLVFWDTQGGDFPETTEDEEPSLKKAGPGLSLGESKSNPGEAAIVRMHVRSLVDAGVKSEDIAVITPYNAQVALLAMMLKEEFFGIEIGSVDGFQGREKEAVIVSLVRSGGEVGFLAEKRRLNVSMTRPKRHLCVIGDSATLSKGSPFLKRWIAHLEEHADLRYPNISDMEITSH